MGGGLLQLVAYGAQDVYLTGNPQITFFKVVYRRHTNFALESIQQTFNGNASLGSRVSVLVTRNGDLINRMYFKGSLTKTGGGDIKEYYGLRLLKNVELEIGGQRIDKQYGEWMYIWNELSLPKGKRDGYDIMVGASAVNTNSTVDVCVPLEFWFCRNVGLALPLIALQYHEVKVNIEFATLTDLLKSGTTGLTLSNAELWVDYVYLDTDERRRFAQLSHEYLIEQLQFTGTESVSSGFKSVRMNFNHPVKELVWTTFAEGAPWTYTETKKGKIQLNGNDRIAERHGDYFTLVQPYQHHTNIPDGKNINVYSFALKPEEHQPSGTLNMSRIDSAHLYVEASGGADMINVYAVNYNVLRILSGMGGLAYSN